MIYDVSLKIKQQTAEIGTDVTIQLEVYRAENGLYIASCPMRPPLIAGGETPRHAILEYLSYYFYNRTVEAEN